VARRVQLIPLAQESRSNLADDQRSQAAPLSEFPPKAGELASLVDQPIKWQVQVLSREVAYLRAELKLARETYFF